MFQTTSKDGTTIAFDRSGAGPVLVLVGGAFSYRDFPGFVELAGLLSNDFTVVGYDRRGRGDSGDTAPYEVQREVEDLAAVIDAVGGSAHVWGMSSGGALALEAAASGVAIEKLSAYEPPYLIGEGHRPPADHREQLERMAATDRLNAATWFMMTKVFGAPAPAVAVMRLLPMWKRLRAVAHTLPYDAAVMGDYGLPTELLAAVSVPTLVLAGEKSPQTLRNGAVAAADAIPNGRSSLLTGQRHSVSWKVLAPVLREFFAD
jgi:pimeloyl-ACP methyl ester carboxylesterase